MNTKSGKIRALRLLILLLLCFASAMFIPAVSTTYAQEDEPPCPISFTYEGPQLFFTPGKEYEDNIYITHPGSKLLVKYDDGSVKKYICKTGADDSDDFYLNGDVKSEPLLFFEDDSTHKRMTSKTKKITREVDVDGHPIKGDIPVYPFSEPISIKFVPAKDFVATEYAGEDAITEESFFGQGNKFIVRFKNGTTGAFEYIKNKRKEGFYCGNLPPLSLGNDLKTPLKKGFNSLNVDAVVESTTFKSYKLSFKAKIKAVTKPTVKSRSYTYTGKVIKPRVKVYQNGVLVPRSCYTYHAPKKKMVGDFYSFDIKFKPQYRKKYGYSIACSYHIDPPKLVVRSVKAGKNSLTVRWKKPSKPVLKRITGYEVTYTTDPKIAGLEMKKSVPKGKSSTTIRGLESGQIYYVRTYSYRVIPYVGFLQTSKNIKTYKVKVK